MNHSDPAVQSELAAEIERSGLRVSVAAVIVEDERLLLVKHGEACFLPGGGQEGSESLREVVRREVLEETGYGVEVGELLFSVEHEPKRVGDGFGRYHKLVTFFAATRSDSGSTAERPDVDHESVWQPLNRLDEVTLVPDCSEQLLAVIAGGRPEHFER